MVPGMNGLVDKNLDNLRLLVIAHYLVGAYTIIVSSAPLLHVCLGLILLFDPRFAHARGGQFAGARVFGITFIVIGGGIVAVGWTLGILTLYAGRCIKRRQRHFFCIVIACLNCIHFPVGIILGVFTLIVLTSDPAKQLFKANHPP